MREAAEMVGTDVRDCAICHPDTCYGEDRLQEGGSEEKKDKGGEDGSSNNQQKNHQYQTKYWRFDQTSPRYTSPTSLVLPSIPSNLRVPPSRFEDIESYIKTKYANPDPGNTTNVFLMEYNPGIAPIPVRIRAYLPWNARYLLSLRVTPHNFCFPLWLTDRLSEDMKQTMHSLNHMGLALLDEKYQMIPGHDVVIDIDRQLEAKRESFMGEPAFVDYRLFTLNDELYLHVNSDTVILTKLRLRSEGIGNPNDDMEDSILKKMGHKQIKLKNLYGGDQFKVTLLHQFNTIWGEGKKSVFGKNYALFSLPNATHPTAPDSVYAEMSVHPDHLVQQILPDEYDKLPRGRIKLRQRRNFKVDYIMQRKMRKVGNATQSSTSDARSARVPSFFTADEHWFPGSKNPFKEFAHGGACCVSLSLEEMSEAGVVVPDAQKDGNWEGIDSVLVGVGHTLVMFYAKNKMPSNERMLIPDTNYVSFLYAFDPRPPFQLLARSGYFCLGFASTSEDEEGGTINPHSVLTHNRPLQQNNETFACAQIHYVSTIIEKLGDSSTAVIGYGMNDCTARLVEVSKKEIARLLFPDPWDMVASKKPS